MIFALIIWSTIFILQKRYLLAALLYCVAVLAKQISIYYSAGYVGYLLVHYVIHERKFDWLRLMKLVLIVIGSIIFAFLPFNIPTDKLSYQLTGGGNQAVGYSPLPTMQMIYAIVVYGIDLDKLHPMPVLITLALVVFFSLAVMSLIHRERFDSRVRFPVYLVLSGLVFFELMPIAHEKHLLFISIPLM